MKAKPAVKTPPARKKPVAGRVAITPGRYNLGDDWKAATPPLGVDAAWLRGCLIWEYARESERLIELVDAFATGSATPGTVHPLDEIGVLNKTLTRMIEAAGERADLRIAWRDLPPRIRGKMIDSLFVETRAAHYAEVERACKERVLFEPGGFQLNRWLLDGKASRSASYVCGGIDGTTVVSFVVDAAKAPSVLAREIEKVLSERLKGITGKGRSGKLGAETCRRMLTSLRTLRLASTRGNRAARLAGGGMLTPGLVRLHKLEAMRYFAMCFPGLVHLEGGKMISVSWYERRPQDKKGR